MSVTLGATAVRWKFFEIEAVDHLVPNCFATVSSSWREPDLTWAMTGMTGGKCDSAFLLVLAHRTTDQYEERCVLEFRVPMRRWSSALGMAPVKMFER